MKAEAPKDVNRIFVEDGHLIDEALKQGVRDAVLRHKEAGLPVVIYRDGKAVRVMRDDILHEAGYLLVDGQWKEPGRL